MDSKAYFHDGFSSGDLEKGAAVSTSSPDSQSLTFDKRRPFTDDTGAVPGESFEVGNSIYARLQRLAGKLNIEQRGIERVPEDERTDTNILNVGSMVSSSPITYKQYLGHLS